ncbi:Putative arginase family protein [Photobacterium marinum]|uniref:Putative arginase family protein n=1 Tax=Photobacterium marinum TaxID=1056511 RepID=L8JGX9_9GAMM|nr:formimidoylglutamase [Photobacterium marinum]ELR66682.1 Putative arginase family protein [Photobacterium marinum]
MVQHLKRWFQFSFESDRASYQKASSLILPYADQRERGAVLLGMASDLSIGFNHGYLGAKEGPHSIHRILKAMRPSCSLPLYDAGIIDESDAATFEDMQARQYERLRAVLQLGHFPVMLGGGHEIAIGSYKALSDTVHQAANDWEEDGIAQIPNACASRVGIINFDACFELRPTLAARAGSAFHTVASYCRELHREFNYLGLGICDHVNSQAAFSYAKSLGAEWLLDRQMTMRNRKKIQATIQAFLNRVDHVHLSIDLSVFSSAVAEGVNMSRVYGVSLSVVEMALKQILTSGKVRILDIAELSPEFDYENQTAKLAAKLIQHSLKHL